MPRRLSQTERAVLQNQLFQKSSNVLKSEARDESRTDDAQRNATLKVPLQMSYECLVCRAATEIGDKDVVQCAHCGCRMLTKYRRQQVRHLHAR